MHSIPTISPEVAPTTLRMPISLRLYSVSNIVRQNTPINVMSVQMTLRMKIHLKKRNSLS